MATLKLLYRSTKPKAFLTVRVQHRQFHEEKYLDFIIDAKSEYEILKEDWEALTGKKALVPASSKKYLTPKERAEKKNAETARKIRLGNHTSGITKEEKRLQEVIIPKFNNINFPKEIFEAVEMPVKENKPLTDFSISLRKWLQGELYKYYHPNGVEETSLAPTDIVSFVDYFLRENKTKDVMRRRYKILQMRLREFEQYRFKELKLSDFNYPMAYELVDYYIGVQRYKKNTIQRDFGYINSILLFANTCGTQLHKQWKEFKFSKVYKSSDLFAEFEGNQVVNKSKINYQYFTLEEIKKMEGLDNLSESMDNVRDWSLIGFYTAQRISDFLRFNRSMIVESKGRKFLKFEQQKTKNKMVLPLSPKVLAILDKRDGDFPRKISDQKFNLYLKTLCRDHMKFTELVPGFKMQILEGFSKPRKVFGDYERWELISSHIFRRSFATNFYKKMPIHDLMYFTGHRSAEELYNYLQETPEERGHDIADKYSHLF